LLLLQAENDEIYSSIMQLRDQADEFQLAIEQHERRGDYHSAEIFQQKLNRTQQDLLEKNKLRHNARLFS
jgi:hypothetical protein